jgi:hypothetical protein
MAAAARDLPGKRALIVVTLETSRKTGMGGGRPRRIALGVMAFKTFAVFCNALVNFGVALNKRPVHAQVIPVSAPGRQQED